MFGLQDIHLHADGDDENVQQQRPCAATPQRSRDLLLFLAHLPSSFRCLFRVVRPSWRRKREKTAEKTQKKGREIALQHGLTERWSQPRLRRVPMREAPAPSRPLRSVKEQRRPAVVVVTTSQKNCDVSESLSSTGAFAWPQENHDRLAI